MKKFALSLMVTAAFYVSAPAWAFVAAAAAADEVKQDQPAEEAQIHKRFAEVYRPTMKGSGVPGSQFFQDLQLLESLRGAVRKMKQKKDTRQSIQNLRDYYLPVISTYMTQLLSKAETDGKTEEFQRFWESINAEITEIQRSPQAWELMEAVTARALLLASSLIKKPDEVAESIFALRNVQGEWTSLLVGANAPTPDFLLKEESQTPILAWKHSAKACMENAKLLKQNHLEGHDAPSPSNVLYGVVGGRQNHFSDPLRLKLKREFEAYGPVPVYALLDMDEFKTTEFGLTTMLEAILQDIYPVTLTNKEAAVHTVKFSPHEMAMHDLLHAQIDTREEALSQAALNKLADYAEAGGNVLDAVPAVVGQITARYHAFQRALLKVIERQKEIYLKAIAAILPEDKKIEEKTLQARKAYNTVITGLALLYHELYTVTHTVLEAKTFDEALDALHKGGADDDDNDGESDITETPATPWSQWDDETIKNTLRARLSALSQKEFSAAAFLKSQDWKVEKTPLLTSVTGIVPSTGYEANYSIRTVRSMRIEYEDINTYLRPIGNAVPVPNLEGLSYEQQLRQELSFVRRVKANIKAFLVNCIEVIKLEIPEATRATYDQLMRDQDAEWAQLKQAGKYPAAAASQKIELTIGAGTTVQIQGPATLRGEIGRKSDIIDAAEEPAYQPYPLSSRENPETEEFI